MTKKADVEMMNTAELDPTEVKDVDIKVILKSILEELKGIKVQLARQHHGNEHLDKAKSKSYVSNPLDGLKTNDFLESLSPMSSAQIFSVELRNGPLLHEALKRYKLDLVPSWSTLYGANLAREEVIEDPEAIARDLAWTSITGECWKIPNDNRVTFCFLAPGSDTKTLVRVRNFLFHFHKPKSKEVAKGENFNVWDWFDTGISAYWFPGKTTPSMPQEALAVLNGEASSLRSWPSNTAQISHLAAPWRRIINLQGLTTLENCGSLINREEISDSDLCPFLITDTGESIFQRPIDEMIERAIKCHLRCLRISSTHHDEMRTKDCALFHVTFYEILQRNPTSRITELWPCGDLYSDGQQHPQGSRQIREAALTVIAVPSREMPGSKARAIFWTMICLRPSQFPHLYYSELGDEVSRSRTNEMVDDMSDLIHKSLVTVVSRWDEIAQFFDDLLTEKRDLLHPDHHDSLLTDDEALSRSKKYFWAIEFLKEAGNSISDNIRQTERFLGFLESNPPGTKKAENEFHLRRKRHHLTLQKLESLETRFRLKREEAVALRDGLFSASTVIDSRASIQLGQNVKLLTFVSIFFLPLSFCASVWSINNMLFSMTAFAIVTPIIGISTYIIVFNLSRIAAFFTQLQTLSRRSREPGLDSTTASHGRPSSAWHIPQFYVRKLLSKAWSNIPSVKRLIPGRRRKGADSGEEFKPTSFGDLRDVHVKIEVDVETGSAT
ncbi:uncharacterized protein PAC_04466 [Phialocephala subalpina]|uniref:Uncharacterized protein n=1 Tax=Phialocephala subalpina TaxID=576137 RepID=A0A1L7WP98_9HELO|nr:uncharacterized protein PAC_04466 [Phialocephala subalpina]